MYKVTGKPVEELFQILEYKFISKEYFMYSMPISPKLRDIVLKKVKNENVDT